MPGQYLKHYLTTGTKVCMYKYSSKLTSAQNHMLLSIAIFIEIGFQSA